MNKLISDETYARIAHLTWNELAYEYEKLEKKNEVLKEGLRAAGWQDGEIDERVALLTREDSKDETD